MTLDTKPQISFNLYVVHRVYFTPAQLARYIFYVFYLFKKLVDKRLSKAVNE